MKTNLKITNNITKKNDHKLEVGQWYIDTQSDNRLYILTSGYGDKYYLVNVQDGNHYSYEANNLLGAFGGDLDDFVLVEKVAITLG